MREEFWQRQFQSAVRGHRARTSTVRDSPLRHHHLKTANIPRRGDLYTGRVPMLFNQDVIAYRARPAKAYDRFEYYKNGGADEIIFVFHGGGVMESVFGKLPYRAEDYIVIPRAV